MQIGVVGEQLIHSYCYITLFNGCNFDTVRRFARPWMVAMMENRDLEPVVESCPVTSIWAGDSEESRRVADACRVSRVCESPEEVIEGVDALLVLDENQQSRTRLVRASIEAGVPVFCDKVVALEPEALGEIYSLAESNGTTLLGWSQMYFAPHLRALAAPAVPAALWAATHLTGPARATHSIHLYWILRAVCGSLPDRAPEPIGESLVHWRPHENLSVHIEFGAPTSALAAISAVSADTIETNAPANEFGLFAESVRTMVAGFRGVAVQPAGLREMSAAAEFVRNLDAQEENVGETE